MNIADYLSDDGQTMLALCSAFRLKEAAAGEDVQPLKLSEWNELERQIRSSSIKIPSALRGRTADEVGKVLALPLDEAERIVRLLDRSGRLALELENIFSRGMWAVTRADELYPARLRDALQHQAPTVLFGAGEIQLLRRTGVAVVGSRNIDEAGAAFAREVGRMGSRNLPGKLEASAYIMKHGPTLNHWNEYIFCAYTSHQHNAVFLTGIPDIKESLPHA